MSLNLTSRQEDDLHRAMLDYLVTRGFHQTSEQLKIEVPQLADIQHDPNDRSSGLLVKKWTSVIRMQKKIIDLESRLAQALEETSRLSTGGKRTDRDWLPTSSAKRVFSGHRAGINAVAFHPVFSTLATASDDTTVKIWDWDTGELERTLKAHTKHVTDCQYDSRGKYLVTASYDLFLRLWNVDEEYKNFATLRGHEHSVSSACFLPGDDRILSSSRDNTVRIWEVSTSHCVKVIKCHEDWIRQASPSTDGRLVLTCSNDHTARVVDIASGTTKVEMRGHDNVVEVASFVPAVAIPAIRELLALPASGPMTKLDSLAVAFVVTGSRDKTIKLWDGLNGRCLWTFVGHDNWVRALVFHPNGKYMLSAADDHTIRCWELKTGRCSKKVEAHELFVACLAWAPTSAKGEGADADEAVTRNLLASGGSDQVAKVWMP